MGNRTVELLRREKMEMTLPVLLDLFMATKKTEGKSPATVSWYQRRLGMFFEFLGDQARIADLTLNNARAFVASLQERTERYIDHPVIPQQEGGLSIHYIHSFVRAIKAFGAWLAEESFVPKHPFEKLKRPKLPETVIDILSDAEIGAISQNIKANTFLGARMAVVFSLLLDTGVRAGELIGLTVDNTNLDENYIKVKGKGNKERIVPFGNTTKKILLRYLVTFRPKCGNNHLILSVEGEPLTYDALAHLMKHLGEKVAIPRLHPHLLRHTFAVRYLISGGDLMTLIEKPVKHRIKCQSRMTGPQYIVVYDLIMPICGVAPNSRLAGCLTFIWFLHKVGARTYRYRHHSTLPAPGSTARSGHP